MSAEKHPRRPHAAIDKLPIAMLMEAFQACIDAGIDARLKQLGLVDRMTPHALRVRAGMKMEDVAARANGAVTPATISNIETGVTHNPDPEKLNAIATALGVTPREYRAAVAHLISMRELRGECE